MPTLYENVPSTVFKVLGRIIVLGVCVCVNKEDESREKRNERARENNKRRVQQ